MSDEEERLLAEIRADPDAHGPREVYADILVARGDIRGEYIAIELAARRGELNEKLRVRRAELVGNEDRWTTEEGLGAFTVIWKGGFPEVLIGSDVAAIAAREVIRRLPVRVLSLVSTESLAALAELPELDFIERVSLHGLWSGQPIPRDGFAAFCASPRTRLLREIKLEEHALDDTNAALLAGACWLPQVDTLAVIKGSLTGYGFERMFERPWPKLRELRFLDTEIGDRPTTALIGADLPALERLRLDREELVGAPLGTENLRRMHARFGDRLEVTARE